MVPASGGDGTQVQPRQRTLALHTELTTPSPGSAVTLLLCLCLCGRCTGVAVPLRVVPSPKGLPSKIRPRAAAAANESAEVSMLLPNARPSLPPFLPPASSAGGPPRQLVSSQPLLFPPPGLAEAAPRLGPSTPPAESLHPGSALHALFQEAPCAPNEQDIKSAPAGPPRSQVRRPRDPRHRPEAVRSGSAAG